MKKKILLVEDDILDATMIKKSLKKLQLNNEVIWLETGKQLLDYLDESGTEDIAVVLLDLQMPQITGIEALTIIRQKSYPYIPIVILTSSKEVHEIKKCYELGANSFVNKPVKNNDFSEAIKTLGIYWGLFNEVPARYH